jgi:hypothetical protein
MHTKFQIFAVKENWFDFEKYLISEAFWLSDSWLAKLFYCISNFIPDGKKKKKEFEL